MKILNLDVVKQADVVEKPYPYFAFDHFIKPEYQDDIIKAFPMIEQGGSFALRSVDVKEGVFAQLLRELESHELRDMIAQKLNMDLSNRPPLITLRGYSRAQDGQIHTDTKSKLVTVLVYLNPAWPYETGKIRIVYDNQHLEPYATEVEPLFGNCLVFKVTDNCWHGFLPYEGVRRSIQLNYVVSSAVVKKQQWRHHLSAFLKKLFKK